MNDLTILHLSDLHIGINDMSGSANRFQKLIGDIEKFVGMWHQVIVVVTGDIVNGAKYDAEKQVLEFFEKLKNVLGNQFVNIHIVPGNHDSLVHFQDKAKSDAEKKWERDISTKSLDEDFYEKNQSFFDETMSEYIKLVNKIYKIFGRAPIEKPYNVVIDEVNGKNFCFIECTTVINTGRGGTKDQRKARCGKYQLKHLSTEHKMKMAALAEQGKEIDLTFLLTHHPINWLKPEDEELLQNYAIARNTFDVDFILCGHTHIQDIYHINKNYKSMITLATGMGWADKEGTIRETEHRYASYNVNLDANSMEVYNRFSNKAGVYSDEVTMYSDEQMKEMEGKIIFPLKMEKNKGYFMVSTVEKRSSKPFYYSKELMEDFHAYRAELNQWLYDAGKKLHSTKEELFREIVLNERRKLNESEKEGEKLNEKEVEELRQVLLNDRNGESVIPQLLKKEDNEMIAYKKLDSYMQYLCERLCTLLFKEQENIEKGRVHFRYGCPVDREMHYRKLCAFSSMGGCNVTDDVSEGRWDDLIKEAFLTNHTLIYSVNKEDCKDKLHIKWDNYLTAIPKFAENRVAFKSGQALGRAKTREGDRPLLSFGITIKGTNNTLLYYLDYIDIAAVVGDLISDYIGYTSINFKKFIESFGGEMYD